jgi:predicted transcriptional regulator
MIIKVDHARGVLEIVEPSDFKSFAVRIHGAGEENDELLDLAAVKRDRSHAWIAERWLREWPPLKDETWWQEGLSKMMAVAARFGWVDKETGSVRAHIERVGS